MKVAVVAVCYLFAFLLATYFIGKGDMCERWRMQMIPEVEFTGVI
jgi:hypothetical protein